MAMIAVPTPTPSSTFHDGRWGVRSSNYANPRADPNPVALPSIRQVKDIARKRERSTRY